MEVDWVVERAEALGYYAGVAKFEKNEDRKHVKLMENMQAS